MDNYFNFESPNSLNSKSNTKSQDSDKDKKFILIEKNKYDVYSESEWKEFVKKNDYTYKLDKLVKSLFYGIPNKLYYSFYLQKRENMGLPSKKFHSRTKP